jgi:hypothetical protein
MDLDAADIARGYKALLEVERGWRDLEQLELRPVYHRTDERIVAQRAAVVARAAADPHRRDRLTDTWRNLSAELDRIQLHTYDTGQGTVSQRTGLTAKQSSILERLGLPEPPRYYDSHPSPTDPSPYLFAPSGFRRAVVTRATGPSHDRNRHRTPSTRP